MTQDKLPNRAQQRKRNGKWPADSGIQLKMTTMQAEIMSQLLYSLPHEAQALYKVFQPVAAREGTEPEWLVLSNAQAAVLEQVVASEIEQLSGHAWAQYRRERFSAGVVEVFSWLSELYGIWQAFCDAEGHAQTQTRDHQWYQAKH
ncbi:MAG: hypothetical protein ABF683_05605 [Sporolactobacillus sp.]